MMKVMRSAAICLLLLFSVQVFSQDFEVPDDYSFEKKEDYAKYEKDIVAASKWLFANPMDKQNFKRKMVSRRCSGQAALNICWKITIQKI